MKYWVLWMIAGIVAILAGILALANPFAASLAAVALTGWAFLLIGSLQIAGVALQGDWRGRVWSGLIGLLGIVLGAWLVAHPDRALLPLTFVIGWIFLALGLLRVLVAWPLREGPFFWPLLLAGFLSAALGMMVLANFHAASLVLLGVLLAVELLSSGVAAIALALVTRRLS